MINRQESCELNYIENSNDPGKAPIENEWQVIVNNVKSEYLSINQNYPWVVGFSGGKDSTLVVQAVFEAITDIPPFKRKRHIHIVSNDTLVESPLVIDHLNIVTHKIAEASSNLDLPITVSRTRPDIDKSFWVLLIGKGYPSPNQTMRWCTDRLKILPTTQYIKNQVSNFGSVIILLGVRNNESTSRNRVINKYQDIIGSNLSAHSTLSNALVYRPILHLTTFDVWEVLTCINPPWGGTHNDLIQLYKDSEGGECPVVLSSDDAPGCGTPSSRFGCWTCTVVEKDKSLEGLVKAGNSLFKPLVNFRIWLRSIRNDPYLRHSIRRNGKLSFTSQGKHIPGPFTIRARKMILDRLLDAQEAFGKQLISNEELDIIYQEWSNDLKTERGTSHA